MADKKFIIEVRSKGFARSRKDIKGLDTDTKQFKDTQKRMRQQTKGLIAELGTLRNKILVYTFAVGGAVAIMNKFVNAASGFQDVKTRLVGLTGSVEEAEKAFASFNKIASKTPFQLQDVVSAGAQLEAFGVNSQATLKSVTDLAAFMGLNATEAASALGRAFAGGAGSADILRERGILQLIKDSQGITDLTKITLPQFRVALLKAMADPNGRIAGSADRLSETYTGAVSNMKDAMTNFAAMIGESVLPTLTKVVKATEKFFRSIDVKTIAEATFVLGNFVVVLGVMRTATLITTLSLSSFNKVLKIFAFALSFLAADKLVESSGMFDRLAKSIDDSEASLDDAIKRNDEYIKKLEASIGATSMHQEANEELNKSFRDAAISLMVKIAAMEGESLLVQEEIKQQRALSSEQKHNIKIIEQLTKEYQTLVDAEKERIEKEKSAADTRKKLLQDEIDLKERLALINATSSELFNQSVLVSGEQERDILITKQKLLKDIVTELGLSNETYNFMVENLNDLNDVYIDHNDRLVVSKDATISLGENQKKLAEALINTFHETKFLKGVQEEEEKAVQSLAERTSQFASVLGSTNLGQINAIKSTIAMIEANRETIGTTEEVTAALKKLNEQLAEIETSQTSTTLTDQVNKLNMAAGAVNSLSSAFKTLANNEATAEQKLKSFITGIGGLMQTIGGATGNPLLGGAGALVSALGGAIAHTGGLIHNNGVQRFATGGVVQGQDNVPIMAQAGEFVMRRSAVQNIGVQNLADMNRTGNTSSGLTINIAGDMIGNEDHVRTKVLPFIKNELRREANA